MIKLYVVGNDRTDEYSRELSAAIAASRSAGAEVEVLDAAVLNTDAILARSPDVVISAGLSDSLSVLLKDQGIVSIVFGTLSEYSSVADIVIDHKAHDTMLGYRTKDFSLVHNPGFNFNETADLIRKLDEPGTPANNAAKSDGRD